MAAQQSIAVAGAHGKTTTTSMIAVMLEAAASIPRRSSGPVAAFGSNARLGQGEYFIAEADESDGSFLRLRPLVAVITNIDQEHLEAYRDFEDLQRAFVTFANSVAGVWRCDPVRGRSLLEDASPLHHPARRHVRAGSRCGRQCRQRAARWIWILCAR
jgi:UDP-N-acetylmuramate-alanine ligase